MALRKYQRYAAAVGSSAGDSPLQGSYSALLIAISYFGLPTTCAGDVRNANPNSGCAYPPIPDPNTPTGGPALTHTLSPVHLRGQLRVFRNPLFFLAVYLLA
jgi:hypothetical protein